MKFHMHVFFFGMALGSTEMRSETAPMLVTSTVFARFRLDFSSLNRLFGSSPLNLGKQEKPVVFRSIDLEIGRGFTGAEKFLVHLSFLIVLPFFDFLGLVGLVFFALLLFFNFLDFLGLEHVKMPDLFPFWLVIDNSFLDAVCENPIICTIPNRIIVIPCFYETTARK